MMSSKPHSLCIPVIGPSCLVLLLNVGACAPPTAPKDPFFDALKAVHSTSVRADRLPIFQDAAYICSFQGQLSLEEVLPPRKYVWGAAVKSVKLLENDIAVVIISAKEQTVYRYTRPVPLGFSYQGCVAKSKMSIVREPNEWVLKGDSRDA